MISAIETTFSLKKLKTLKPKVTKILRIFLKKFCESLPWTIKKKFPKLRLFNKLGLKPMRTNVVRVTIQQNINLFISKQSFSRISTSVRFSLVLYTRFGPKNRFGSVGPHGLCFQWDHFAVILLNFHQIVYMSIKRRYQLQK